MDGAAFEKLSQMKIVWLGSNDCINENFEGANGIAAMPEAVTERCGFCRSNNEIGNCQVLSDLNRIGDENSRKNRNLIEEVLKEQKRQNIILELELKAGKACEVRLAVMEKSARDEGNCQSTLDVQRVEMIKKVARIAALEAELSFAKLSNRRYDTQVRELTEKLEAMYGRTFYAVTDLPNTAKWQEQRINEVQAETVEFYEYDAEIREVKKRDNALFV